MTDRTSSRLPAGLPPGIEPDVGTFININPTTVVSTTSAVSEYINPTRIRPTNLRPSVTSSSRLPTSYTPRPDRTTPTTTESKRIVGAGPPFLSDFTNDKPKSPYVKKSEGILKNKQGWIH